MSIPKPMIAAINGPCAGIGLVQALMCDLRFAADGAKLTTAFREGVASFVQRREPRFAALATDSQPATSS